MGLFLSNFIFLIGLLVGYLSLRLMFDSNILSEHVFHSLRDAKNGAKYSARHVHTDETKGTTLDSAQSLRILCWIMTGPEYIESRTRHIRATWAQRCDKVLYMSSVQTDFPTVGLNVSEGRDELHWKTIRAFQYIHQHHLDEANWFLKADDDMFVVVENLRYVLSRFDPEKPLYLGGRFKPVIKQGMSRGPGYVLSKEALRRFIRGFDMGKCTNFSDMEDTALGKCLETMKVELADVKGKQTLHAFPSNYELVGQLPRSQLGFLLYEYYDPTEGPGCCTDLAVYFHYIDGEQMYVLDYLMYHLRPYGYKYRFNPHVN
ncbi:glycoprotein-N-acetylgalactosamine 3-beta-galactosyltransferase 1-like [Cheilinus undulatus]|uniref:glycoprotein-N-acetylgalactosamine 3-beta-galactosyltransferase 1-like n=1 Tax=Cheilinus undulatus TaxID=241271 RepID=UPI001BD34DD7|nr:glycoprotein-N-acetylgalactosamine 3-beta-galactosyltransferase 1-like [Cheilinus undulatus]